ncbi:heat shock 70 kDa protein 12A-like [Branchiostoma floridae x Branchiostoma belcheri]
MSSPRKYEVELERRSSFLDQQVGEKARELFRTTETNVMSGPDALQLRLDTSLSGRTAQGRSTSHTENGREQETTTHQESSVPLHGAEGLSLEICGASVMRRPGENHQDGSGMAEITNISLEETGSGGPRTEEQELQTPSTGEWRGINTDTLTDLNETPRSPTSGAVAPLSPITSTPSHQDQVIHTLPEVIHKANNSNQTVSAGQYFVVVAIDFGTTFSGYAFSFLRNPDSIHVMRKWEGGDPGVTNQKVPTTLLLTPTGLFHSFGFAARDNYHDLEPGEAKRWMYFERFKMVLHANTDLHKGTQLTAGNGKLWPAVEVFAHALRFFKDHALQELTDQSCTQINNDDVRWVITVPAIWRQPAKQFMREAAYKAGMVSRDCPEQLLIALEPEAASIYCRQLRYHQLVSDSNSPQPAAPQATVAADMASGDRYMVVDCGGGTVDLTVHQLEEEPQGGLKELHKASGGPYGSIGVDEAFERLLHNIFGSDFIEQFKRKRPAGWVDLLVAFEARKRAASPYKTNPLNVSLPFSFIDYFKKTKGSSVEAAIRKSGYKYIKWSSQGMLRMSPEAMRELFLPTLSKIVGQVITVLQKPDVAGIKYLFLVGGFSESPLLQHELRAAVGQSVRVMIPQDVGLSILKGAVLFGLDPAVIRVRRSALTYGVGILNKFVYGKHPPEKLIIKDGVEWCTDVFDTFVTIDQSVAIGDRVTRSYTPAKHSQSNIVINIYCSEREDVQYITETHVQKCGTLKLDLTRSDYTVAPHRRELQTTMQFGDTEIRVTALDILTCTSVKATIDFLNK